MNVAPAPQFPERSPNVFERSMAPSIPGNRGPLRFEEGVATDTDVPNDFARGAYFDPTSAPGRQNHNNPEMFYKYPEETMRERAHVGSAAWVEAPTYTNEFSQGTFSDYAETKIEEVFRTGSRYQRMNPASVTD